MVDRQRIRLYALFYIAYYVFQFYSIRQGKGLKFLFDIPTFKLICQCVLRKKLLTFGKF